MGRNERYEGARSRGEEQRWIRDTDRSSTLASLQPVMTRAKPKVKTGPSAVLHEEGTSHSLHSSTFGGILQCLALLVVACSAETATTPAAKSSRFRPGVYTVERVFENRSGCELPTKPSESDTKCFYLNPGVAFGTNVIAFGASSKLDTCQRAMKGESFLSLQHIALFSKDLDGPNPSGEVGGSAVFENGTCVQGRADFPKMRELDDGGVRVEIPTVFVSYPGKDPSDCMTDDSFKAAEGKPCSSIVVFEGRWQE